MADSGSLVTAAADSKLASSPIALMTGFLLGFRVLTMLFHWLFGARLSPTRLQFAALSQDKKRTVCAHASRCVLEFCFLFVFVPALTVVLNNRPWTPLAIDCFRACVIGCAAMYVFELAYRSHARGYIVFHHVAALAVLPLSVDGFNPYTRGDAAFASVTAILGMFVALEFPNCFAAIYYHLARETHLHEMLRLKRMIACTLVYEAVRKITQTVVYVYFYVQYYSDFSSTFSRVWSIGIFACKTLGHLWCVTFFTPEGPW